MTPRTRKYFAKKNFPKFLRKHLHKIWDIQQKMIEISQPLPRYPKGGTHSGGFSFVGENNHCEVIKGNPIGIFLVPKDTKITLPK